MMKYEIFKDVVENAVLDYLPPEFQNSELHLQRVKKVNGMENISCAFKGAGFRYLKER